MDQWVCEECSDKTHLFTFYSGPGASSMTGLFTEMGPCLTSADTTENNGTYRNEHSWSNFANLLFIE